MYWQVSWLGSFFRLPITNNHRGSGIDWKKMKSDTVAGTAADFRGNSLFTLLMVGQQDTITGQI
jgi:hypothetical protein